MAENKEQENPTGVQEAVHPEDAASEAQNAPEAAPEGPKTERPDTADTADTAETAETAETTETTETTETIEGTEAEEQASLEGEGDVRKAVFSDILPGAGEEAKHNLDLLMDVTVPLTVELGNTTMKIEEILRLSPGAVIELDKHADQPIDLKVNGKLIARGEIVVVEDFFGIRINEIVATVGRSE